MPKNEFKVRCKAKNRQGEQCGRWATIGYQVCKNHGSHSTGAPPEKMKGNKNSVKTGEYESIWLDSLEDDEKELYDLVEVDVMKTIDESLKLIYVRERRMLNRIKKLKEKEFNVIQIEQRTGTDKNEQSVVKRELNTETIQRIEEGLTRLQDKKLRLLDMKQRLY
jgi:uncharacterized protein YjcR